MEAEALAEAEAARAADEKRKAAYDARKSRRGRPPKLPDDKPPPERQSNLTDPDSALIHRFSLRGIGNAATEWTLFTLACNCKRMVALEAA